MNSLDDLRSTLGREAAALHDNEHAVRTAAVHGRIRAVRRRRMAAVSVAAALVIAGAAAATGPLGTGGGGPRPASVLGVDVPRTIEVDGFPYAVSGVREVDGSLRLGDAERERAVTLVADRLGSGSATLYAGDQPVARVRGDERTAAPVWIGEHATDLRIALDDTPDDARTGLAFYDATGALADGVTNSDRTSVFRWDVAGNPLITGAFAEPGDREVRLRVPGSVNDMRFSTYCVGAEDLMVNVSVDGDGALSTSCGAARRDAGSGSSFTFEDPVPGSEHDVRVYLTRDDQEVAPDGVDFGVGIYQLSSLDRQVLGQRVPARVEYGGRTWELGGVSVAPTTVDTGDGDVLLGFAARGSDVSLAWQGALTRAADGAVTLADGGLTTTAGLLLAGDRYDVRLRGDAEQARLLVYLPA